ncbi:hypothetical protein GIB67_011595 [Kingdonia uniflora]|uniref:MULE transposase domain-containing protein n=1 Tax=Kingdonia uniflora TaxID=39325 RepID=A0A7J7NMF7_9MAGN|nr:hypothetical protein GIB67_011595 [Kingdonia uniflora]
MGSETTKSWTYFLEMFGANFHGYDTRFIVISDRNPRIINAIPKVFPFAIHTLCAFHISNNIKTTIESTRIAFRMAAEALASTYFDKHMNAIRNTDPVGLQYILGGKPSPILILKDYEIKKYQPRFYVENSADTEKNYDLEEDLLNRDEKLEYEEVAKLWRSQQMPLPRSRWIMVFGQMRSPQVWLIVKSRVKDNDLSDENCHRSRDKMGWGGEGVTIFTGDEDTKFGWVSRELAECVGMLAIVCCLFLMKRLLEVQ